MNDVTLIYDFVSGPAYWKVNGDINICLNGKTISANSTFAVVNYGAKLSVTDCGTDGKSIGGIVYIDTYGSTYYSASVYVENNSTFNLYGGTLLMNEDGKDPENRLIAMRSNSAFNMYGGNIGDSSDIGTEDDGRYLEVGGGCTFNAYGGAIYGHTYFMATFSIHFGETAFASNVRLLKNYAGHYSGNPKFIGNARKVWVYPMYILKGDTEIRVDDLNKDDIYGDGGSVKYAFDEKAQKATLTLTNANIVYGTADRDAINYAYDYPLEIVLVGKNTILPEEANVYAGRSAIKGAEQLTISGSGSLKIISYQSRCLNLYEWIALGNKDIKILTSDNADGSGAVYTEPGNLDKLEFARYVNIISPHNHCVCGGKSNDGHESHTDIEWQPWIKTDSIPTEAGNYYLVTDVSVKSNLVLRGDVNLCLNGSTVSVADDASFEWDGNLLSTDPDATSPITFTLTDCIGGGMIDGSTMKQHGATWNHTAYLVGENQFIMRGSSTVKGEVFLVQKAKLRMFDNSAVRNDNGPSLYDDAAVIMSGNASVTNLYLVGQQPRPNGRQRGGG